MAPPALQTSRLIEYGVALGLVAMLFPLSSYLSGGSVDSILSNGASALTSDPDSPSSSASPGSSSSSSDTAHVLAQSSPDFALLFGLFAFLKSIIVGLVQAVALTLYHTPRLVFLHTPRGILALLGLLMQPLHPILAPLYLALEVLAIFTVAPLLFIAQIIKAFHPLYTVAGAACIVGAGAGGLARFVSVAATGALFPPASAHRKPKRQGSGDERKKTQPMKRRAAVKKEED